MCRGQGLAQWVQAQEPSGEAALPWQPGSATPATRADHISKFLHLYVTSHPKGVHGITLTKWLIWHKVQSLSCTNAAVSKQQRRFSC